MFAGSALIAVMRVAAWMVLVAVGIWGQETGRWEFAAVAVAIVSPVAILEFVGTVASIWRGPPIIAFEPEKGLRCGEQDSEPVRAYAQLRGMIGGAGHVFPSRLVFPSVAWGGAVLAGALRVADPAHHVAVWSAALAVAGCLGAWLFPSRPYWYREVMGGGAIVSPPEAVAELVARELREGEPGIAVVHETGQAAPILRSGVRSSTLAGGDAADALRFSRRQPRYAAARRMVVVEQGGREYEVATLNVSDGGLAVRWPAELPVLAERLVVKLRDGARIRGLDAVVRWNRTADRERTIGFQVMGDGGDGRAWRSFVDEVARTDAPRA